MKKRLAVFGLGFLETYLITSFYVPSLQIRLIAPPLTYFTESISSTWLFKSVISIVVALLLSIGYILKKKEKTKKVNDKVILLMLVLLCILTIIGVIARCEMANHF